MKVGDYVRFDYHRLSTPIQIAKITETHYDSEDFLDITRDKLEQWNNG